MTRTITIAVCLGLFVVPVFSQSRSTDTTSFKTVELHSPWGIKTGKASCFSLVTLAQSDCRDGDSISYGNRIGEHWDIFALEAKQSRMIDLGPQKWTDHFSIPEIEPWPLLRPGERRTVVINTTGPAGQAGADGAPGTPGRNADPYPDMSSSAYIQRPQPVPKEGFANAPLSRQVTSTVTMSGESARPDLYNPMTEVKLGHMYLVRVVDLPTDHYVLIRLEELVRGEKAVISFVKFDPKRRTT